MDGEINGYRILVAKSEKEKNHYGDLSVNGTVILK
jgi:hypothetical protein